MLKPINKHILIEPIKHESFMFTERQTYDEVGTIVAIDEGSDFLESLDYQLNIGDKVFFDSWLASKFPKEGTEEFYWLVPFESIKAYEPLPA